MRTLRLLALVMALSPAAARAEGWELAVLAGKDFPFYDQQFDHDPGPLSIAGLDIQQQAIFRLDARGGLGLSAVLSRRLAGPLAVEARLDTADVSVHTEGAQYRVRAGGTTLGTLDFGTGTVDLKRLRPLSLNLRLQSRGATRVAASGGISYLPDFEFAARQGLALRTVLPIDLGSVTVGAEALPREQGEGRLGANVGLELSRQVRPRLRLLGEVRYFHFQKQTITWGEPVASRTLGGAEQAVVDAVAGSLEPVDFNPTFFHSLVGVAFSF